jgi:hypothetical protein
VGHDGRSREVKDEEVLAEIDEILAFAGMQGGRTLMERLEDDKEGRRRMRVRVVRGEGKVDYVYDVLIEATGLMGIYPGL